MIVFKIITPSKVQAFNDVERLSNEILGYSDVRTTMTYTHALNHGVLECEFLKIIDKRRDVLSGKQANFRWAKGKGYKGMFEPLIVVISKDEVLSEDISPALGTLKKLIESPKIAQSYREKIDISFQGYDHHPEELYEIPEVRNYVYKLDEQFPFWLYFLSKKHLGLQALLLCFLPPYLKEEAKQEIFPKKTNDLLTKRWFPALNHIGAFVDMPEDENEAITERTIQYVSNGPL